MQNSTTDSIVGRRLRIFRVSKGLDLETMGAALRIDATTLDRYENGLERIPPRTLRTAAAALNISLHAFFDPDHARIVREPAPEPADRASDGADDISEVIELLENFSKVKDRVLRAEILKFVAFLSNSPQ
ncbi:helix-turn-helix domain-containing protein [Rhodoblastus acidophilus]|nr:helix-turn-helix transcriptional regulator [Rhodoblastus acidophilus]PPQ40431.1 transcriptional regulator [Rhodoblastus acidophilus]RAI19130.1 transcriptional regulator [Rhodoblastus acidophilus]